MAREIYKEQIVEKEKTMKSTLIKVGVIFAIIVIFIVLLPLIGEFAVIIIAALGFGAFYLFRMLSVEYEYTFTNGELDIDCIYSKARRKRVFSGVVRDFEIMAHAEDRDRAHAFSSAAETKDYSSGSVKKNTYAFLTTYKGKRIKVLIEPDDVMMQALASSVMPNKMFKRP